MSKSKAPSKVVNGTTAAVEKAPQGSKTQSVPLKVDATQLNAAFQKVAAARAAGPQFKNVTPADPIKEISDAIARLYARFDALKKLAAELTGMNQNDKIPEHIKIKSVHIEFSLTKDGKTEEAEATLYNPTIVGDLSSMLTTEYGFIISSLKEYSKQLEDLSSKTHESCSAALSRWEETSNRRIVQADGATVGVETEESKPVDTSKPVTLQGK